MCEKILEDALFISHYGSFVYGTFIEGVSDKDYIAVIPDIYKSFNGTQYDVYNRQYTFYTKSYWENMLMSNDVTAIETFFLPEKFILKNEYNFKTIINKEFIRREFSATASNSFVKAKKKLTIEKDFNPRIAKKSLWHALRILNFGIQIIEQGKITDYSSMNYLYNEIVNCEIDDWEYYKEKYKPLYNSLKTKFKLAHPIR